MRSGVRAAAHMPGTVRRDGPRDQADFEHQGENMRISQGRWVSRGALGDAAALPGAAGPDRSERSWAGVRGRAHVGARRPAGAAGAPRPGWWGRGGASVAAVRMRGYGQQL
nr:hypothetical protein KPHV_23180 [Kitasatospora purpeofusca]